MSDISSRTFRTVRKGFDPDEVRRYLVDVQAQVNAGGSPSMADLPPDAQAEHVVMMARAEADQILADANMKAEAVRVQTESMQAWLNDPSAARPGAEPAVDSVQKADEIIAAAQAQAEAMVRDAEAQASSVDRWDGLGEHVARIVAQAEQEATAIVAEARAHADDLRADAEAQRQAHVASSAADRAEAARSLVEANAHAAQIVAEAEAEAASLRIEAEPKARQHIESVLATAQQDLDTTRTDLQVVLDQLHEVQTLVTQSLAHRKHLPEFYAAERFLNGVAIAPAEAAAETPAPAAAATPPPAPVIERAPDPVAAPTDGDVWSPPGSIDAEPEDAEAAAAAPAQAPAVAIDPPGPPVVNPWGADDPGPSVGVGSDSGLPAWPAAPTGSWPVPPRPDRTDPPTPSW